MSPKNHVDVDHYLISKKIEKEVQNMTWEEMWKGSQKKKQFNPSRSFISNFFVVKDSFKKDDIQQKQILMKI
jgi:hypothetical protein